MNNNGIVIPGWSKKLKIGIPEIDSQHQYFLSLIRNTYELRNLNLPEKILDSNIDLILFYANYHFSSEEHFMKICNYPDFEVHKQEHQDILENLFIKANEIHDKDNNFDDFIEFLVSWFVNHTTVVDQDFAKYAKTKKL